MNARNEMSLREEAHVQHEWAEHRARRTSSKLTVVVIPGHGKALYRLRLNFWLMALGGLAALLLVGWSAFVVGLDWKLRSDLGRAEELRRDDLRVAMDLAQGRDALLRVATLEGKLRRMLAYKTKKALFKAPAPGPDEQDVLRLAQDLEQDPASADADVRPGVQALIEAAQQREQSVDQVLRYVQDRRTLLDSKPSGWPVHGWISSGFGKRVNPVSGRKGFHAGVDIANDTGTPVRCTADGRVAYAGWEGGYGKLVIVHHGNGFSTYYGHLSQIKTSAGAEVKRGSIVGLMGATGNTTGPHVHYEIRLYGVPVNPVKYMHKDRRP